MKFILAYALSAIGLPFLASGALAADAVSPVAPEPATVVTKEGWTFTVAPYFWAAGLSGDIASFGLPAIRVDPSFSDIFDHLDFGAMATPNSR